MKKIFFLTIIISSVLSGMGEESLKKRCLDHFLQEPRAQLATDLEHRMPLDLHDNMRERWYSELDKNVNSWVSDLARSNNHTKILSGKVTDITFNEEQDRILVRRRIMRHHVGIGPVPTDIEREYNLDGNWPYKGFFVTNVPPFVCESQPDTLTDYGIKSYGLDNVWRATLSKKNKKIIGIKAGALGILHDYAPGERFKKYIAKRAPLAQILLLEALRQAHEEGEKIMLTAQEKEILNGMPPTFEKANDFLRKFVK